MQEDTRSPVHLSNTAEYKDVTLYFNPGLHFVSWIYYKDAQEVEHENLAKLDVRHNNRRASRCPCARVLGGSPYACVVD